MEPLTSKRKEIVIKPLNLLERAYLPAILGGLRITGKHFFKKPVTISYPEERREFSENFRGQHSLKRDEEGRERCTACGLCALSCPAEAITMTAAERQPGEEQ
jgi:NADH-quinone oxidoreductase subunit I